MHTYLVSAQHRITRWRKAEAESGDSAGEQGRHPRDGGLYLPGEDFHDATMTRIVPLAKLLRAQASASSALGTSPVRVSDACRLLPACRCSRKGDQGRAQSVLSPLVLLFTALVPDVPVGTWTRDVPGTFFAHLL